MYFKRMITFSLLLGVTVAHTSPAFALGYYPAPKEQCSSVDFRQIFPLKMRNQGETSWCFAHAASDLLQYQYHLDEQISAADIAINYSQADISKVIKLFKNIGNTEVRKGPPETGFISIAIKKIIPQGYCPESVLPSDFWTRVNGADGVQSKKEILQSILETYELQTKIQSGEISDVAKMPAYFIFSHINRDQFFDILKRSSHQQVLVDLRNAACVNERKPFGKSFEGHTFHRRGRNMFQKMNASLDDGKPVTVDFFDDLIFHYDHPRRRVADLHTVLVYGKKFNEDSQECQYMLKDSHGAQCTKYDPKIPCEDGYLWVPESKLYRAVTSQLIFN